MCRIYEKFHIQILGLMYTEGGWHGGGGGNEVDQQSTLVFSHS